MRILASFLFVSGSIGLAGAAPPAVPPRPAAPAAATPAGPALDDAALPSPRPMPGTAPAATPVEEPAPAPHERPGAPVVGMPPGQFREEAAPMPREQTPSPPRLLMPAAPRDAIAPDVATLHRELEILRMEREAMLVEEMDLVTAKDLRATRSNDVAKYRKRISELLARAAEKARKDNAPPTSPAPQPTPKGPATQAPNQPPAPAISPTAPATVANPPESSPRPMPTTPTIKPANNSARVVTDTPVDPLALAQSYFQAGDYAAALNAYRKLEQEQPRAEDLVIIQYMRACCLRKLGKLDEASVLYREAANTAGNEFVAENAQWYLRTMKERRELEAQLDELRQRRQSLMPRKP